MSSPPPLAPADPAAPPGPPRRLRWFFLASALFSAAIVWGLVLPLAGAAVLAFVSWLDDRRGLNPATRLIAQLGWVIVGLFTLPPKGSALALVFQGVLPLWLDWAIAAALWLWFINAFNFMDGIDGLAGAETASIGVASRLT